MMPENVNKNVFKIVTLPNNLVHILRLLYYNLVFCSRNMIREICVFWYNMVRENFN